MQKQEQAAWVREGRCALGIELGSTRIKAVLIGPHHAPVAMGAHDWENRLEDGDRFCGACGHPVEEKPMQETANEDSY